MSLYFRNAVISFTMDAIPLQVDNFSYGPIHRPIPGHSHGADGDDQMVVRTGHGMDTSFCMGQRASRGEGPPLLNSLPIGYMDSIHHSPEQLK